MPKEELDQTQIDAAQEAEKEEQNKYKINLTEQEQKDLVEKICYLVEKDEADRKEYLQVRTECRDLYEGKRLPKSEPWPKCYSKDTDILTERGWVPISEVSLSDAVYSMNMKTGEAEYMPVLAKQQNYYEHLLHFKSKSVDLLISPEHNMLVWNDENEKNGMKLIEARKLFNHKGHKKIPLVSKNKSSIDFVYTYGYKLEDWLELLGWYISEGCVNWENGKHGTIRISQVKNINPINCSLIENLLDRMKITWHYSGHEYLLSVRSMPYQAREEIASIGTCEFKHIPRRYLCLKTELLNILLATLVKGDGHIRIRTKEKRKNLIYYYTCAKQLADDVQEIIQKIGKCSRIHTKIPTQEGWRMGYVMTINNKIKSKVSKLKRDRIIYKDYAYCLTTPYHTVYVRRNGTAVWCGNCANVSTQIVTMVVEILHSRLFPSVWNEDLIYWKPIEKSDLDNVENISKFMKWVIKEIRLREVIDDFTHNLILDGTAILKIRWVPEWKWVQVKKPRKDFAFQKVKSVLMRWFGGKKRIQTEEQLYDLSYEYKKFEKCKVEVIDLEDAGFPLFSVPSAREEELEYFWHRFYPSYDTLVELAEKGIYENVDKIGTHIEETFKLEGTKKADIDAEHTKITQNKYNQRLECIEMYMRHEGEDVIVTVDRKTRVFLGAKSIFSISKIGEKPFVIGQLIRRTNRMFGKGIAELVMPHQKEMDAIHNQRLDAGTMAINPIGVYRAGSGFEPEKIEIEPGLWIPVDDVNDAKWIVVPNNVMVSFQEEKMLMELIEKITSVGAYQSGQESDIIRSRATARGTMAIIQQGEVRFNILARRVQNTIARGLNKVLRQYQEKIPPGLATRVLGPDGEQLFPENISPEDLAGNYDSYLVMDSTGGSKDVDRQVKVAAYQNLATNPFVMQNPEGFWELTAQTAKALGIEDVETIIGEKPKKPEQQGGTVGNQAGTNVGVPQIPGLGVNAPATPVAPNPAGPVAP